MARFAALALVTACAASAPDPHGPCVTAADCRSGQVCAGARCADPAPVQFRFRQWVDDFESVGISAAGSVVYTDGGALTVSLPSGFSPRGAFAQLAGEQLPLAAEGKVAGRIRFTNFNLDGTSGVHLLDLEADGGAPFLELVLLASGKLSLSGAAVADPPPVSGLALSRGSYFFQLGWKLGDQVVLQVDEAKVLTVALDGGSSPRWLARGWVCRPMPPGPRRARSPRSSAAGRSASTPATCSTTPPETNEGGPT
ncbi:MAG: hypothetical protein IPJ65_00035 [Archangiaceae bacterium]|nr:hypothetical protein [Archangiaceae bacterium]